MTITSGQEALTAMRSHHRLLSDQLDARAAAAAEAVAAGRPHAAAVAGVVAYLAGEVLPHAVAEEETIYRAATAAGGELAATVSELTAEHGTLSAAAGALAGQTDGSAAAQQAREIAALFAAHAARENDVLLPAMLASSEVDLGALLGQLHRRAEEAATTGRAGPAAAGDPQLALLGLLLESTRALARAGQPDLACRLTAAAWAALREDRPDLAVTVTAALHGLARRVSAGSAPGGAGPADGSEPDRDPAAAAEPELDVRDLAPAQRHETIFATYHDLAPGEAFVLVNDHDPKPLRYQFEAEHAGQFSWESRHAGPEEWRVRIGRPAAAQAVGPAPGDAQVQADGQAPGDAQAPEDGQAQADAQVQADTQVQADGQAPGDARAPEDAQVPPDGQRGPVGRGGEPDLDVRPLAHWQRHDAIFTAYRALPPGGGFVLVNDHDPLPLRYQFEAQYPGGFTWDYQQAGPEAWRVRIGRSQ